MNNIKKSLKCSQNGNISVMAIFFVIFFAFIFLLLSDFCRIFVIRSVTKKASDSASLAVSQQLLFFKSEDELKNMARQIVEQNKCGLRNFAVSYDEIIVSAERKLDFVLLQYFGTDGCMVYSVSKSKVIYPWDEELGLCRRYRFEY